MSQGYQEDSLGVLTTKLVAEYQQWRQASEDAEDTIRTSVKVRDRICARLAGLVGTDRAAELLDISASHARQHVHHVSSQEK